MTYGDGAIDMQTVLDERVIVRGLGRFARILDEREWQAMGEVFADDISFDYGEGGHSGIGALLATFRLFLDPCGPSQHLLGSIVVTVEGNRAYSRAYVQARHQGKGPKAHLFFDSNGEYRDRWERRSDGWRIVRRDAIWFMMVGDRSVLTD